MLTFKQSCNLFLKPKENLNFIEYVQAIEIYQACLCIKLLSQNLNRSNRIDEWRWSDWNNSTSAIEVKKSKKI